MKRLVAILSIVVSAFPASADTVVLRSGEHDDFTRIVAFLPDETDWQVVQNDRQVEVTITGETDHKFDSRTVFDRIPRTRISDVKTVEDNQLTIELACHCRAKSFFQAPNMLVFDVTETDQALPSSEEDVSSPASRQTDMINQEGAPIDLRNALKLPTQERQVYSTSSVSQFAQALANRTTRQVLEIGAPNSTVPTENVVVGTEFRNVAVPNIALPEAPGSRAASGLRDLTKANCTALSRAPIDEFLEVDDFYKVKNQFLAALYTDGLQLDRKVATRLAQLYLSQGLGAEAAQLLDLAGFNGEGHEFLRNLAAVIEASDEIPRIEFEKFEHCSPANVLWSNLAAAKKPMTDEEGLAVVRIAEGMPRPLLRTIAPRLITNLFSAGQPEAANLISKIVDRSGMSSPASMAEVLLSETETEQDKLLESISHSNGEEAAEAAALLVDRHVESGEVVPAPLADLVASHAVENRHRENSGMLRKAEAYSLISRGDFDLALDKVKTETFAPEDTFDVRSKFFESLTASDDTVTFLRIVHSELPLILDVAPEVRRAVAARLYQNQFPQTAARLIETAEPLSGELLAQALSARASGEIGISDDRLFSAESFDQIGVDEARYHALLAAGELVEAKKTASTLGRMDPVDTIIAAIDPSFATDAFNPATSGLITLKDANELADATASLADSVTSVLNDPGLGVLP